MVEEEKGGASWAFRLGRYSETVRPAQGSEPSDWHEGPALALSYCDHQGKAAKSRH